jgi:uncharacterized protein (TIGR01777 family)
MSTKILITGGTGLLGSRLSEYLTDKGYQVSHLSRGTKSEKYPTFHWNLEKETMDSTALDTDYIIHLTGAGIMDKAWTAKRKGELRDSRINTLHLIKNELHTQNRKIKGFISASAVGIYGYDTGREVMTEESAFGHEYVAELVKDWEGAAQKFDQVADFTSQIRIGIVLDKNGGALPQMVTPIRMGIGSPIGHGKQYMSWIHFKDLVRVFDYVLQNEISGAINAVAPNPATNEEITKALATELHKPLWLPNVPAFVIKAAFGDRANLVLGGNRTSYHILLVYGLSNNLFTRYLAKTIYLQYTNFLTQVK